MRIPREELRDLSSLMLSGVKVKYGRDSNEYEMAGGTRLSGIRIEAEVKEVVSKVLSGSFT